MNLAVETLKSFEKTLDMNVKQLRERKANSVSGGNGLSLKNNDLNIENNKKPSIVSSIAPVKDSSNNDTQNTNVANANNKFIREFLVRRNFDTEDFIEVRVAVVGNVDSGKSTLLGVLTHGVLDDGRGEARTKLFRHKHEIESGRTSSVGNDILGFDASGNIVNDTNLHGSKMLDWEAICSKSSKVKSDFDFDNNQISS